MAASVVQGNSIIRVAWWALPTGLVGGAFTALFGTGGAIYTIYLARRLTNTDVLRASIGVLVLCTALVRLVLFTGSGFYKQPGLLPLAVALLPAAFLGFRAGSWMHARLPTQQALRVVWLLLVLGGLSLLARAYRFD